MTHRSCFRLLKCLNSLYRPALPDGFAAASRQSVPVVGASPSGKAVDFDSTIRRFESSRPSQQINDLASRILRCGAACRHQRETKWEPQRETHRCQQVVGRIAGNDQPQELSVQKMRSGTHDGQESEQGVQRQSNCKLSRASKTGAVPRRERLRCRRPYNPGGEMPDCDQACSLRVGQAERDWRIELGNRVRNRRRC
jgi:hypothetical protein